MEEVLEKENAYDCDNCKAKSSTARKSSFISHLSNSLIFTANCFYYNLALKTRVKKMNTLRFCREIAVPEFVLEGGKKSDLIYELYAIIIHSVILNIINIGKIHRSRTLLYDSKRFNE
jgi:ubiquitin C-terminal hydrolase